jgi:hypothetical protein
MGWHGDAIGLPTVTGCSLVAGTPSTQMKKKNEQSQVASCLRVGKQVLAKTGEHFLIYPRPHDELQGNISELNHFPRWQSSSLKWINTS